jgi:threonine aldolase
LICLENTYGATGGTPVSADYIAQVGAIAQENGLQLHIDGARIFNAAAALNIPVDQLVAPADSLTFCLSKGLCAPVGSILVGSQDFIRRARRTRKILGGGMRQAGILAAAGLIALREMTQRLHEDHANACALAEGLLSVPHISLDLAQVQTNMVLLDINESAPISYTELVERLYSDHNIRMSSPYKGRSRMVTHYWISRDDVETVIQAMRTLLS